METGRIAKGPTNIPIRWRSRRRMAGYGGGV